MNSRRIKREEKRKNRRRGRKIHSRHPKKNTPVHYVGYVNVEDFCNRTAGLEKTLLAPFYCQQKIIKYIKRNWKNAILRAEHEFCNIRTWHPPNIVITLFIFFRQRCYLIIELDILISNDACEETRMRIKTINNSHLPIDWCLSHKKVQQGFD